MAKRAIKSKVERPFIYDDGQGVHMPSEMLTTEAKFKKIWSVRFKGDNLDLAWDRAKKWLSKFE
jgi:hypothetical protein